MTTFSPAGSPATVRLRTTPVSTGARISGIGSARPAGRLSGAELGARVGRTAEWIEARTGIRELRVLRPGESLTDLALCAATAALADAGARADTVDLVLGASCSRAIGSTPLASEVARALAPDAGALDLNAACAGFSYSLATADALIRDGSASRVLVVAAEQMTGIVDPNDLGTSILFGDGAGAAVVTAAGDDAVHIGPAAWGSDGSGAGLIAVPPGEQVMTMAGQQVFRWAVGLMPDIAREACRLAGVTPADIDLFVPHQANARIIDAVAAAAGLERAEIARDVVVSGNTSAASIPLALTRLREDGRYSGRLALLLGFGAGLAWAGQVVRIP